MSIYYTDYVGNEFTYLKESIFAENKRWYSQSNLKEAKILFAFSWQEDDGKSYENDKMMSFVIRGVRETYSDLRIVLVLNSPYIE